MVLVTFEAGDIVVTGPVNLQAFPLEKMSTVGQVLRHSIFVR